jgi:hypothetical protein
MAQVQETILVDRQTMNALIDFRNNVDDVNNMIKSLPEESLNNVDEKAKEVLIKIAAGFNKLEFLWYRYFKSFSLNHAISDKDRLALQEYSQMRTKLSFLTDGTVQQTVQRALT